MTSILKVSEIQDPTNSNTALTIDANGVVSMPNTPPPLGVGQTWTDVLSSRAKATEYQNTTSGPIMVSISFTSAFTHRGVLQVSTTSGSGFVTVADADGGDYYSGTASTGHYATVQAIVPVNHYYQIIDAGGGNLTLTSWAELR